MTISEVVTVIPTVTSKDKFERYLLKKYLDVIEDNYVIIRASLKRYEMSRFLYYACLFYDRFAIPTKYFIDIDDFKYFKKYFTLFKKIELEVDCYVNIVSLELDLILWEIYDSLNHDNPINTQGYRKRIMLICEKSSQLKDDNNIEKLKEYQDKKDKVESILCGVEKKQLKMNVSFSIPIVPLKLKTIVNTKYLNKEIQISFNPNIFNNTFVSASEGTYPVKQSKSNWQQGITDVSVEIYGFVDLLIKDSSLYVEIDSDDNHAHNLYKYLYYLLSDTLWNLKTNNYLCKSNWLIEPNDIESVIYEVVSCQNSIEWKYFPSKNPLTIQSLKDETQLLSIDLTKHIYWFEKCLILSKDYLSLGNSNLSIFWLNIGIESFFEQKISEICNSNDIDESSYKEEDYFQKAKEELQKINSKSIYKKIIWPKPFFKFVTVFKTIKKLSKDGLINCSQKDLLSCYYDISKHRNKLFHGSIDSLIDVNDAKKAISSYERIINNFI